MQKDTLKKIGAFAGIGIAFFILLLFVFRAFVFDPGTLMLNSDQLNGIGSKVVRAQSLVLSEWDDSRLGGVPTIDALFGDAYHPLVLVEFLTDPARAVGFKFILIVWVAFLSAMALAKSLTGSLAWGTLFGFLYAFSPQYFSYVYGGHDGKMMVFAVAPLAILAIRKIIREASIGYFILFVLSVVWMILGSHLQLTYLFLWGAGFYALFEMLALSANWKTRSLRLGVTAGALAIALGISAFQIIPPYLYTTTESVRGTGEKTNYGHAASWSLHQEELASMLIPGFIGVDVYEQKQGAAGLELSGSSLVSIPYADMQKAHVQGSPFYWGHNAFKLNHDSAGIVLTFLAFLGFFVRKSRRAAAFWFVGAAVALSYAMGVHSPLFKLWFAIIPGMKSFRAPSMAMFWLPLLMTMMAIPVITSFKKPENRRGMKAGFVMFLLLLAIVCVSRFVWSSVLGIPGFLISIGYGALLIAVLNILDRGAPFHAKEIVKSFQLKFKNSSKLELGAIFVPFLLTGFFFLSNQKLLLDPVTAIYFKPLNEGVMEFTAGKILPSFVLALIATVGVFFALNSKLSGFKKAAVVGAIAAIELYTINGAFIQNVSYSDYVQPKNPVIQSILAEYPDSLNRPRVLSLSRNQALSGNSFPLYGMRNADGFHDNELASYRLFRGGQNNENYMYNINQVAQGTDQNAFLDLMDIGDVIFDSRAGTQYIPFKNHHSDGHLYGHYVVLSDSQAVKALREGFDYKKTLILAEEPEETFAQSESVNGYGKVVAKPKMDDITYQVSSDKPAFLLSSGNFHRYWKATVNGKPAKVYKAFGTLRAVAIPQGTSTVRLEYKSDAVRGSLTLGLVACIVFVGSIAVAVVLKKRSAKATA
ncbi:MAG: hypothetical protein SPL19_03895 [Fibrobacter sp.]|nr:hypothetical protein [Fibrobacter sp.]MDY6368818.1 hypothetical protein [Fibrobacter sp.]MDY6389482.1 hypothetical protein [Fibrobacter sp.]